MHLYRPARLFLGACLVLVLLAAALTTDGTASASDPELRDDLLVGDIQSPTGLAFTPDGRLLITTQTGRLRVVQNGALVQEPALDLSDRLCTNSERGLLGVAVDPEFSSNRYIYLYYTFNKHNACPTGDPTNPAIPVNRVARFILADSNQASGETILLDDIPSPNGNHNAGDLHFGKDGYLYVSVGDGGADYAGDSGSAGNNDAARDRFILLGKILRITRDGGIPPDNPFLGPDSARCNVNARTTPDKICQETYAWGFRNPFRIAMDPNAPGVRLFVNDVGQGSREEVDHVQPGGDYGWNCYEGTRVNSTTGKCAGVSGFIAPIYDYGRAEGCTAITGGAFVPNGLWPGYDGAYLYGDYGCGKIFKLTRSGATWSASEILASSFTASITTLAFGPPGPSQALYYATYANGGQVRRVTHRAAGNTPPVAAFTASPLFGPAGTTVSFDAAASSDIDPGDADSLTYAWNFGDGATGSGKTTTHTYSGHAKYTVTLTVTDPQGASDTATQAIDIGGPNAAIEVTSGTLPYAVGETITLRASATGPDGQPLSGGQVSFVWNILLHHDSHTHPFVTNATGAQLTITAPPPEDLAATNTSYLEVRLRATDSAGVSGFATRNLLPHKVNVSFNTDPANRKLLLNGVSITAPRTVLAWEGYKLWVSAPPQQDGSGRWLMVTSWSNGGPPAQTITTPGAPATYIATFGPAQLTMLPLQRQK